MSESNLPSTSTGGPAGGQVLDLMNEPALQMDASQFFEAQSENIGQGEVQIARLAMIQPQSPEITQRVSGYEQGMIVDNKTRQILSTFGPPPWMIAKGIQPKELTPRHYLEVALIFKLMNEYIKWIKIEDRVEGGDNWEFKTLDATDPRVIDGCYPPVGRWGTRGEDTSPPVTENRNILLLPLDDEGKMKTFCTIGTFSRTSAQAGKDLTKFIETQRLQDLFPWSTSCYLTTIQKTEGRKTWMEYQMFPGRPILRKNDQRKDMLCPPFGIDIVRTCMTMGVALMDKTHGRTMQSNLLNAQIGDDATVVSHDASNGTEAGQVSKPADPFGDLDVGEGDEGTPPEVGDKF